MTSGSPSELTPVAITPKKGVSMVQKILLVVLLFIGFLFGGYYFGTQAQFKALAGGEASGNFPGMAMFDGSGNVKKWYWIHTKGWNRAGYQIMVMVNGQLVGNYYKPDVNTDVTKYIKPGRNKISFDAKSLPLDQRDGNKAADLVIELRSGEKKPNELNKFQGGDMLIEYKRLVTETENFHDVREFETIE